MFIHTVERDYTVQPHPQRLDAEKIDKQTNWILAEIRSDNESSDTNDPPKPKINTPIW